MKIVYKTFSSKEKLAELFNPENLDIKDNGLL